MPAPAVPGTDPFAVLAVRALCALIAVVGALLLVIELVQRQFGPLSPLAEGRLWMGAVLTAGGAAAYALGRRGWLRLSGTTAVLLATGAIVLHAWHSGLGTYSIALAASSLLVAVAGMLVDLPTGAGVAVLDLLAITLLERAETTGRLPGMAALREVSAESRTLSYVLVLAAGLITAWIVRRQLEGNVGRALEHERHLQRLATAEMAAQRELQRSQTMLDRLVRLSPEAICVASLRDGRVLLANPAFLQLAGREETEVIGHNGVELGLWRDQESMEALGRAIRAQGWVRDFRSVAWTRGGADHDVLITAGAFDWDGEPVAVITTRDVDETERAKREADAILDNAVVGVCLVRDRRLVRANPQLERMLGVAPGALLGQPVETLFRDRQRFDELMAQVETGRSTGDVLDIERKTWRTDGARILIRLRGRVVDPERPRESGTIWIVEDITERRRAELELADAKRTAEAANRAKSRFLATMSHEIRTPLSGVLGLARLLQDRTLDDALRTDYLGHLVDAAELLNGIVSDVLDLSKIEAGQLQVERIPFDLHRVVLSTFRTFAPLGREHGLEMRCQVDEEAPREVVGDPGRVRQILANYLSNALKFTHGGHIAVVVRGLGDGLARIEVRDSGIGVSPEVRDQLFQPFSQADSSTTRRFGGSGLGLSICRELAALMGGRVGVDSDGIHGSCFWVELPLTPADEEAQSTLAGALDEPPQPLAGMRVLLAEDNPVNRLIVGAMLRRLGADVVEASDGVAAIAQASHASPSVHAVLMDLHMPEIDGLEATRRLRAQPSTSHLPIIALSAAVLDAERAQAHAAGMNGFIAKPAAEADLLRALSPFAPVA